MLLDLKSGPLDGLRFFLSQSNIGYLIPRPLPAAGTPRSLGFGWYGGAALGEAWQVIKGVEPRHARARPHVVINLHSARRIEASDTYLHPISQHLLAHAKRAPASRTKGPFRELGRTVPGGLSFDPCK